MSDIAPIDVTLAPPPQVDATVEAPAPIDVVVGPPGPTPSAWAQNRSVRVEADGIFVVLPTDGVLRGDPSDPVYWRLPLTTDVAPGTTYTFIGPATHAIWMNDGIGIFNPNAGIGLSEDIPINGVAEVTLLDDTSWQVTYRNSDFATAVQGSKADTAVQPGDLAAAHGPTPPVTPAEGDLWVCDDTDLIFSHYWADLPDGNVDADSVLSPPPWDAVRSTGPGSAGQIAIADAHAAAPANFSPLRVADGALRSPHDGGAIIGVNPVYVLPAPAAGTVTRYHYCLGEWLNQTITADGGNVINMVPTDGVHGFVVALAVRDDAGTPKATIRIGGDMPTFHWVAAKDYDLAYLPGPGDVFAVAIDRDARQFWCEINGLQVGYVASIVSAGVGDDTVEVDGVQVCGDGATNPGSYGTVIDFDAVTLWSTPTKRQNAGGFAASCRWVACSPHPFDAAALTLHQYKDAAWAKVVQPGALSAAGLVKLDAPVPGVGELGEVVAKAEVLHALNAAADAAVQPGDLGTAAFAATSDFATADQGAAADAAVQPGDLGTAAFLAADSDLTMAADSDAVVPTQKAVKAHVAAAAGGTAAYPRRAFIPFAQLRPDTLAGTWTGAADTQSIGGSYAQSGITNTQSWAYAVDVDAGTWELRLAHLKSSTSGIIAVALGGTSLGTVDAYNASTTRNNIATFSGITIATAGRYDLVFTSPTKNALSTQYIMNLAHADLRRTGA